MLPRFLNYIQLEFSKTVLIGGWFITIFVLATTILNENCVVNLKTMVFIL